MQNISPDCRFTDSESVLSDPQGTWCTVTVEKPSSKCISGSDLRAIGNPGMIKQGSHAMKTCDLEKSSSLPSGGEVSE